MIVGKKIREIRKNEDLTQEQFGNLLGVSKRTIVAWEKGERLPRTEQLKKIEELVGLSVKELLDTNSLEQYSTNELIEELKKRVLKKDDL